jgi:hypothetical protein
MIDNHPLIMVVEQKINRSNQTWDFLQNIKPILFNQEFYQRYLMDSPRKPLGLENTSPGARVFIEEIDYTPPVDATEEEKLQALRAALVKTSIVQHWLKCINNELNEPSSPNWWRNLIFCSNRGP